MSKEVKFLQGNEACAEGAIAAGVTFFGGYPITPSTEIAEAMAAKLPQNNGAFIQMEDEIAGLAVVLGASLAGKKVLTATSGPGFSLKQELIGYACMAEIPVVIVNVQRVGPSTGQPTAPSQGDVMQARWGTHGDHSIIALSPWTVKECFDVTVLAVNYAERFRTPVIILMDEIVGHMREKFVMPNSADIKIYPRRKPSKTIAEGYQPYEPMEDLVPNIADFGTGHKFHVTGLLHDETGFPSGSPKLTKEVIDRLHKKIEIAQDEITHYDEFFMADAEYAVVAYGGTARTAYAAVEQARAKGIKVGMVRLMTIWPFADKVIKNLASKVKGILVPELNYGQLVLEVERAAGSQANVVSLPKYNTEAFDPQEICEAIEDLSKGC
ncbi:MAG: 2-oxoacid:acceptor oxidoreductase subunit alpha [Negativicutes bacterium]|nr:2-oxoacid:acceptor oxidoreductase subunit alpha [Negativicutes bacterium]MBP8629880.1 2-oxoacid:acceptor oxidoreductase subunit alpha [Negativicutes bacterium]MBP9537521.1 2-oxoacid:acceptor oxidoreductase subunit alpha [Negativicutes bacterium]MBP9948932.1 2-oxoacid:acceptor oxidoreductase subunit alpha [Negativicutes bacterium]